MVEVTEDDKNIYIKISNNGSVDLKRVYKKNYFFSLGLVIVDDEVESEKKDDTKKETLAKKVVDATSAIEDGLVEAVKELDFNGSIDFAIEKSDKESSIQTFTSYLENIKKQSFLNPLTTFPGSGIDYIILENITTDLCSCLEYIKINGMQLIEKKKEMVYVINGRFIVLSEDLRIFDDKMLAEEESVLSLLSEICGITYSRGEDHFKGFIYGTLLYNTLKRLIN